MVIHLLIEHGIETMNEQWWFGMVCRVVSVPCVRTCSFHDCITFIDRLGMYWRALRGRERIESCWCLIPIPQQMNRQQHVLYWLVMSCDQTSANRVTAAVVLYVIRVCSLHSGVRIMRRIAACPSQPYKRPVTLKHQSMNQLINRHMYCVSCVCPV